MNIINKLTALLNSSFEPEPTGAVHLLEPEVYVMACSEFGTHLQPGYKVRVWGEEHYVEAVGITEGRSDDIILSRRVRDSAFCVWHFRWATCEEPYSHMGVRSCYSKAVDEYLCLLAGQRGYPQAYCSYSDAQRGDIPCSWYIRQTIDRTLWESQKDGVDEVPF